MPSSIGPAGIERRKVKIGENNETHVQILEGLKEGDLVALDARTRATAEFKLEENKKGPEESKPTEQGDRHRERSPRRPGREPQLVAHWCPDPRRTVTPRKTHHASALHHGRPGDAQPHVA